MAPDIRVASTGDPLELFDFSLSLQDLVWQSNKIVDSTQASTILSCSFLGRVDPLRRLLFVHRALLPRSFLIARSVALATYDPRVVMTEEVSLLLAIVTFLFQLHVCFHSLFVLLHLIFSDKNCRVVREESTFLRVVACVSPPCVDRRKLLTFTFHLIPLFGSLSLVAILIATS